MEFYRYFPEFFDFIMLLSKLTGSQEPVEPTLKEPLIYQNFRGFDICGVPYVYINREIQGMPVMQNKSESGKKSIC